MKQNHTKSTVRMIWPYLASGKSLIPVAMFNHITKASSWQQDVNDRQLGAWRQLSLTSLHLLLGSIVLLVETSTACRDLSFLANSHGDATRECWIEARGLSTYHHTNHAIVAESQRVLCKWLFWHNFRQGQNQPPRQSEILWNTFNIF
jgi:hypothetical protein